MQTADFLKAVADFRNLVLSLFIYNAFSRKGSTFLFLCTAGQVRRRRLEGRGMVISNLADFLNDIGVLGREVILFARVVFEVEQEGRVVFFGLAAQVIVRDKVGFPGSHPYGRKNILTVVEECIAGAGLIFK